MNTTIMPTYGRLDMEFVRGQGVWLYNEQEQAYLDALSGIGVCCLGHCHPKVTAAITEQAATLLHTSNLYHIKNQQALADKLCHISGMENVFFANSGAEANEAAIKLARLHGNKQGINNASVLVFEQSFHGRTLATLTASGNRKIQAGFEPLVHGFVRAPLNDIEAVNNIAANNKNITAVLVEPIQGEGGVNLANEDFLKQLEKLCQEHNWLLMFDEVQTGNGRTGKYFAYQHFGLKPDVVTTAKGLGNGLPIGACITAGKAAHLFQPGNHGSTYGGNPLVCKAALTTINTLADDGHIDNAAAMGQFLRDEFKRRVGDLPHVVDIRGMGLMIGIELSHDCGELVQQAMDKQLLINVTAGNTIRLLPPLILQKQEAAQLLDILCPLIEAAAS